MPVSQLQTIHAYRHLYRGLLRAVLYSKPARYIARDHLRNAFRNNSAADFDPEKIARTLQLLEAARHHGIAHKIVKNILRVWGERERAPHVSVVLAPAKKTAYDHFNRSVAKLNETMGLCIK